MGEKLDVNLGCPYGPSRPNPWPGKNPVSTNVENHQEQIGLLQEQLAAKDAEIAELQRKADLWRGFVEVMSDQVNDFIAKLESAERDNRALREEIRVLRPEFPRLSVNAQEAAERAGRRIIEAERDEARECVRRLYKEGAAVVEEIDRDGVCVDCDVIELREALAATPEHLR